jgi:hypothetical protein
MNACPYHRLESEPQCMVGWERDGVRIACTRPAAHPPGTDHVNCARTRCCVARWRDAEVGEQVEATVARLPKPRLGTVVAA